MKSSTFHASDGLYEVVHPPVCLEGQNKYSVSVEFRQQTKGRDQPTASILIDSVRARSFCHTNNETITIIPPIFGISKNLSPESSSERGDFVHESEES